VKKIFNDDWHASHRLFCYIPKPNNSTSQQVNNYEKAVTISALPGQQATVFEQHCIFVNVS